jgi:putative MATE family efflux protein
MAERVKNDNLRLIESGPVAGAIIRLALPMMVGMIAQLVYNMTDTFFIGQTGDPNMVAGISLTFPLFMLSQGIGNIFGVGTSSYISRKLGEKRFEDAKQTNAVSFYTTVAVGIAVTLIVMLFKTPILRVIGTSDVTFQYADDYFSIINIFLIFAMLNIALSSQIRSEGATGKAMIGMLLGIVLNIILDPIFIIVFNWGAAGAAWATVAGSILSVSYFLLHLSSKKSLLSIKPKDFKPEKQMLQEIFLIGLPAALSEVIMSVALILNNIIAAAYGDYVVAGSGINLRVVSVCFMLVMALAMGFQPFAGFNYGATNYRRLREGFMITLLYTTLLAWFFAGVFIVFGKNILMVFIQDELTINAGVAIMRAFIWGIPFLGVQMTMMVSFQALGKSRAATIVMLGRQCLFYVPSLFILNYLWGFSGFIYAQPIADILTAVISVVFGLPLYREIGLLKNKGEK